MKTKKRDKTDRAFSQGFKAGIHGHEIGSCPYSGSELRGLWCGGWREGRSHHISGHMSVSEFVR